MKPIVDQEIFVVQKHHATSIHYIFCIEVSKKLKSWVIPKGIPKSSKDKRIATELTDHPIEYANFEGLTSCGYLGFGKIEKWDFGKYKNITLNETPSIFEVKKSLKEGHIEIYLFGKKCQGSYSLTRLTKAEWQLKKMNETQQKKRFEHHQIPYP